MHSVSKESFICRPMDLLYAGDGLKLLRKIDELSSRASDLLSVSAWAARAECSQDDGDSDAPYGRLECAAVCF